jgi:S-adenosylmethionine hydrolase
MIVLLTDFGGSGPYVGQMKAVLASEAPGVPVIDLIHDLPAFDPRSAAYFLSAVVPTFRADTVFLCIVDPGVGGERAAVVLKAGGSWFVGPDNGLLAVAARRAVSADWFDVTWRPPSLSATFHGRDLFAPVAARLARGEPVPGRPAAGEGIIGTDWPDDHAGIIYIDHYGNAMTGLRASIVPPGAAVRVGGRLCRRARTFSSVAANSAFWYENANGLVEIAVNRGRADRLLGLRVGSPVSVAREANPE